MAADLAAAREEAVAAVAAGDEAVPRDLAAEWAAKLRRLVAAEPAAAGELAHVVSTLTSIQHSDSVTITQKADASEHSTVIQIGGDGRNAVTTTTSA